MSLTATIKGRVKSRFPRVSGDEPLTPARSLSRTAFSPRERG